ncbi:MAG: hypothetical protein ABIP54_03450 [Candidatus Andersenbacteria bacterium]
MKIAPLETIHAIPYPMQAGAVHILENLAHADIFINSPVVGKQLDVTITFNPKNTTSIDMGVRNGPFWLGYDKQNIYNKDIDQSGMITKTVFFPLTSAFQDTNQSIDLMLFTEGQVDWSVATITAKVYPVWPTTPQLKDYIKSLWHREREI